MPQIQATNINAFRAEAQDAVRRAYLAEQEANAAVAAYVAQGGDEADVRAVAADQSPRKTNRSAKSGQFVSDKDAVANPDTSVTENADAAPSLPDSFNVGDDKYEALKGKNGKTYAYALNGSKVSKADYAEAAKKAK